MTGTAAFREQFLGALLVAAGGCADGGPEAVQRAGLAISFFATLHAALDESRQEAAHQIARKC